jgi:hypothetical protein
MGILRVCRNIFSWVIAFPIGLIVGTFEGVIRTALYCFSDIFAYLQLFTSVWIFKKVLVLLPSNLNLLIEAKCDVGYHIHQVGFAEVTNRKFKPVMLRCDFVEAAPVAYLFKNIIFGICDVITLPFRLCTNIIQRQAQRMITIYNILCPPQVIKPLTIDLTCLHSPKGRCSDDCMGIDYGYISPSEGSIIAGINYIINKD